MPQTDTTDILIGEIVGFQGLRGEVKVKTANPQSDWLDTLTSVRFVPLSNAASATKTLTIRRAVQKAPYQVLLAFESYPDRTAVETQLGRGKLYAPRDVLPELQAETFWIDDLIGLSVIDPATKQPLGQVKGFVSSGNQDFLEIQPIVSGTVQDSVQLVPFQTHFFETTQPAEGMLVASPTLVAFLKANF